MSRSHQPGTTPQLQSTTETSRESSTTRFRLPQTLRLRGAETETETPTSSESSARHIRWSEDVVDNEGMGKKSSKVCCIYHKTRAVGESSSEESSSSSSDDSDSESENEIDRRRLRANTRGRKPTGDHNGSEKCPDDEDSCEHQHPHQHNQHQHRQQAKHKRRKPSPNAYEKIPRSSKPSAHGS